MKITDAEVVVLRAPNVTMNVFRDETALVIVRTDEGLFGVDEASTYPLVVKAFLDMEGPHPWKRGGPYPQGCPDTWADRGAVQLPRNNVHSLWR